MKQTNSLSSKDENMSSENGAAGLTQDQLLFTENIYASLPMSIEVYDANGVLRKINDKALKMYGVSDRTTVIGKVNLFNSPYMDEELKSKIQRGEDVTLEFEYDFDRINSDAYFCSQNKNSIIYEAQVVPVLADKGTIIGHILLSNDVTSAKEIEFRTEESKKNLEMAMEAANMTSWIYNVHKKTFSTLHGNALAKEEMSLEQMQSILHPQDRIQLMQLFAQLINKETQQVHTTLRFYNKEERQYRHYESRMRLSSEHRGKLLIVGTQLDVTDKVQMLKKTQDLTTKRELAMQVSNIVHWDFDVSTQKFESYNDPINDYAPNRLVTLKEFESVVHPDDRSTYFDAIQSMLSGENETVNFTCRMQTKYDETWQYCNVIGVPFEQDENGNTIRFTGFRQNISKLHRLNEELKERNYKMELTFKTVGMSYWDFDVTGRKFTAFNDPVNDYHPETPIDVDQYLSAAHPDDRELVRKYFEGMIEGKEQEFNFQYRSKTKWNKEWQTLIITGIQVERDKRGKIIRYTGIGFNNTKWEKMAQELKILKDKAELSDRLKSAFLANMSHEIRTPLNAIVGFSSLMQGEELSQEERAEYCAIVVNNSEMLLTLLNDILDISSLECGKIRFNYSAEEIVQICQHILMTTAHTCQPGVEGRLECAVDSYMLTTDVHRLSQILINLLTNAAKFTSEGSIVLGVEICPEQNEVLFSVTDTGPGIPLDKQEMIFNRFEKLDGNKKKGTGLGLAICRQIAMIFGGRIWVDPTYTGGARFIFAHPIGLRLPEDREHREGGGAFGRRQRPSV